MNVLFQTNLVIGACREHPDAQVRFKVDDSEWQTAAARDFLRDVWDAPGARTVHIDWVALTRGA